MAKITRLSGGLVPFAANAADDKRYVFGTTARDNSLNANVNADFKEGWESVTSDPDNQPTIQDFNALGFTQGQLIAYQMQMGVPEYDAAQDYYPNSVCTFNGKIFISIVENLNVEPGDTTKWRDVSNTVITRWVDIAGTLPLNKLPNHSGAKITSGIVREPYIDTGIARRAAVTTEIDTALDSVVSVVAYANSSTGNTGLITSGVTGTGLATRYREPSRRGKNYVGRTIIRRGAAVPRTGSAYQWTVIEELGAGQVWRDVSSSRGVRVTYTNNYGRTIAVIAGRNNADIFQVSGFGIGNTSQGNSDGTIFMIVPEGGTYRPKGYTSHKVYELR